MTRKPRFSSLFFLSCLAQSAMGQERIPVGYECTAADGSTRRIEIEVDCSNRQPLPAGRDACRVEYTRDGNTEVLWRARNDPSYCRPKVEELVGKLEESGFTCTAMGGSLCDDSVALVAPPPKSVSASDPGPGRISITPSTRSNNQPQVNEIKGISGVNYPVSVRDYLTFTRDTRYGYFLAILDTRLGLSRSDAASLSSSEEGEASLEACVGNTDLSVTFEKLEDFIRRQFNSPSSIRRVVEHIHVFLDDECGLRTAPDLDAVEIDQ